MQLQCASAQRDSWVQRAKEVGMNNGLSSLTTVIYHFVLKRLATEEPLLNNVRDLNVDRTQL